MRYFLSSNVSVVGTFDGSRDLSNPKISYFQFDGTSPKLPGGSETDIMPSSFVFDKPKLRFEIVQL